MGIYDGKKDRGIYDNYKAEDIPTITIPVEDYLKLLEGKQEPKTGHWIDCDNSDDYSADGYDCSVCGVNAEYATSYCPSCGAKMVEPQESEET